MAKPLVFIGSSFEAKEIAREIQDKLSDTVHCEVWDEFILKPGDATLFSLYKAFHKYDFSILVFTPDDITESRNVQYYSARDNIIFELGLSMGVLGPRKSFFVSPKTNDLQIKIPSDLAGITSISFEWDGNRNTLNSSLGPACNKLRKAMLDVVDDFILSFLPSTALAMGYFKNFVLEICNELIRTTEITIHDKKYDLSQDAFDFYVVLPTELSQIGHPGVNKFKKDNKLSDFVIKKRSREFPFYLKNEVVDNRILFFDFPTTLRASRESINLIHPPGSGASEREFLENREMLNFERTLKYLLAQPEAAEFADNIKIVSYKSLGI